MYIGVDYIRVSELSYNPFSLFVYIVCLTLKIFRDKRLSCIHQCCNDAEARHVWRRAETVRETNAIGPVRALPRVRLTINGFIREEIHE